MPSFVCDPVHSTLAFRARAFKLRWVRGTFPLVSGSVTVDGDRVSASGTASAQGVDTGLRPRDFHLRHRHYLHAAVHPTVELSAEFALADREVEARLTARGVTMPVRLAIDRLDIDDELHVVAHGEFERTPLGMLPPVAGVDRRIHVSVDVRATPGSAAPADGTTGAPR